MNDIQERNRQYKELSVSKNREPFCLFVRYSKDYQDRNNFRDDKYRKIMEGSPDYLCDRGDEYKRLGMIEHYYVSNVKEPF